jgi:TrmH family RNA methyltransferase
LERIASRQNPVVREFRAAADAASGRMLLDGEHLLDEALAAGLRIDLVALSDRRLDGAPDLAERAARQGARLYTVTDAVLDAISPVRQPSGVVALAQRPPATLEDALRHPPQLVLMLSNVQDPGNVGAVVRAAEACGATGVVTSSGTADAYGWKALRGSMGSTFRLPVATGHDLAAAARLVRERGIRLYAAVPRDGTPLPRCTWRKPSAVLLGGEGAGLSPALLALADERLTIPMRPSVESLNVATAAALIAYEAQRQRTLSPDHG